MQPKGGGVYLEGTECSVTVLISGAAAAIKKLYVFVSGTFYTADEPCNVASVQS